MRNLESSLFKFKVAFAVSLCITLMVFPGTSSYAERLPEQYGKKVTVTAELTKVKINYKAGFADFNDPVGIGTGEVAVLYSFSEPGHSGKLETELNLSGWDLQWHDAVPHGRPSKDKEKINQAFADHTKYVHIECHPTGTLDAVFTVYNVNGRWPNWEGILLDTAKAAGFASLRQLAIQLGYVAGEVTMGGLLGAAVAAVAIQNIIYTIRGNESLGVGTTQVDLQELGENGEQTYTVTTQETRFGNAEIEFKVKTNTEDIACGDIASFQTGLHDSELYAMLDRDLTAPQVPGWVKQNAAWWSDGTITDADFAAGIGFLVKEGIIAANVKTDKEGAILINENLSIPAWIKQNAAWWSDGIITDADFTAGVEYMVNQKIITFSEKKTPAGSISESADQFQSLYVVSIRNEAITSSLIEITNYQKQLFRNVVDAAWNAYDETENASYLEAAQAFDAKLKDIEKRSQTLSKIEKIAKQDTQHLIKSAEKQGIKKLDLEKSAKGKIWTKVRPDNPQKFNKALKDVENANRQNAKDLEKAFGLSQGTLDDLLWSQDDGKSRGSVEVDLFFDSIGERFFEGYYGVSDHIPIKAVFESNQAALSEAIQDAKTINEIGQLTEQQDSETVTEEPTQEEQEEPAQPQSDGREVAVLVIGGKYYPLSQFFVVEAHTPNCDSLHYHSEFSQVRSSDGTMISDPNPSTCGFGKVGLIPVDVITMTQQQVDAFKEAMGFEP
ncbi:MAG: hypothetical protein AB1608_02220 [Thermoproteota archaeon]